MGAVNSTFRDVHKDAHFEKTTALLDVVDHRQANSHKNLETSFDCAWSHRRQAQEAHGEFIAYDYPKEKYFTYPVVGFAIALRDRDSKKGKLRQGNFDGTPRQMEHFVLKGSLRQMKDCLPENITLLVTIDGDLNSKATLSMSSIVEGI